MTSKGSFQKYVHFISVVICVVSSFAATKAFSSCTRPPYAVRNGDWVTLRNDTILQNTDNPRDSTVLIKEKCDRMRQRNPATWVRGMKVKDNCAQIPMHTAIATFSGHNNTYPRVGLNHAAILVSCNKAGIRVYDQGSHSGGVKLRRYRYGGGNVISNANLFYSIE